jgi:hypothetical protein
MRDPEPHGLRYSGALFLGALIGSEIAARTRDGLVSLCAFVVTLAFAILLTDCRVAACIGSRLAIASKGRSAGKKALCSSAVSRKALRLVDRFSLPFDS